MITDRGVVVISRLFVLIIAYLLLQGCVAVQTFPGAARAGDTITLALGSLEGATRTNLTVTFTSDVDASQIDLTPSIRAVVNLYADKTSELNLQTSNFNTGVFRADSITASSAHSAWLTVAIIDLPAGLTLGNGHITVAFGPEVVPVNLSETAEEVNIGIEILPGAGAASPFDYVTNNPNTISGDFTVLEPMKQVIVKSPRKTFNDNYTSTAVKVYGAEFVFTVPMFNIVSPSYLVPDQGLMVIQDVNRYDYAQSTTFNGAVEATAAQTQMLWRKNGDTVTVSFVSPTGQLYDQFIRFSLVPAQFNDFSSVPTLDSWRYYDQDGQEITGIMPILEPINF